MERDEVIVGQRAGAVAGDAGWVLRRWEREQDFDRALLGWAARFAFVTAAVLAERWGVSEQRMRARLRRLERSGLVRRQRGGPNEPARVVVTEAGGSLVGLAVRTRRGGEPLGHELAVINRVIAIERQFEASGQRDGDQLCGGLERGRSAGMSYTVASQSVSNFRTAGGEKLLDAVLDNSELVLIHRHTAPQAAEHLAGVAGTA